MQRRWTLLLGILVSFSLCTGCASVGQKTPASSAIRQARFSFDKAKAAGAESKAPFEYYAAEAYLEKARHEWQENDLEGARLFAAKSENYSAQALEKAEGGAK